MLPYLDSTSSFPPVNQALEDPNGLLAAGADLSVERLVSAYSQGIFPWFSEGEPILWWSPNPRTVFKTGLFKPSRSLCRFVRKNQFKATLNKDFEQVINLCAEPTIERPSTWITKEMINAYLELHLVGVAHSVEIWDREKIIGGIYGVAIGRLFCGESMFSRVSNGSKMALSCLISYLKENKFPLLDSQVDNSHLTSLGALQIGRNSYKNLIEPLVKQKLSDNIWQSKPLPIKRYVSRSGTVQV